MERRAGEPAAVKTHSRICLARTGRIAVEREPIFRGAHPSSLGAGRRALAMEKGTMGGAVERRREQIKRGRVEKTDREKTGEDGRCTMHGRKERMMEGR